MKKTKKPINRKYYAIFLLSVSIPWVIFGASLLTYVQYVDALEKVGYSTVIESTWVSQDYSGIADAYLPDLFFTASESIPHNVNVTAEFSVLVLVTFIICLSIMALCVRKSGILDEEDPKK